MIKAQRLRAVIHEQLPNIPADQIVLFISGGRIISNAYAGAGFTLHYQAQLILINYSNEPDLVFGAVNDFMREQQADFMDNPSLAADAITFEAEALDHTSYDLLITVKLSEDVSKKVEDGKAQYAHHAGMDSSDERVFSFLYDQTNHE